MWETALTLPDVSRAGRAPSDRARRPALGAARQLSHVPASELQSGRAKERAGLDRVKREVVSAELRNSTLGAQPREPQLWLSAARDHQLRAVLGRQRRAP